MQAVGAPDTRLLSWLAQETTIEGLLLDGEERDRTSDSPGITAPEDRLKRRPGTMMVGLTTNDVHDKSSRVMKLCKDNR